MGLDFGALRDFEKVYIYIYIEIWLLKNYF